MVITTEKAPILPDHGAVPKVEEALDKTLDFVPAPKGKIKTRKDRDEPYHYGKIARLHENHAFIQEARRKEHLKQHLAETDNGYHSEEVSDVLHKGHDTNWQTVVDTVNAKDFGQGQALNGHKPVLTTEQMLSVYAKMGIEPPVVETGNGKVQPEAVQADDQKEAALPPKPVVPSGPQVKPFTEPEYNPNEGEPKDYTKDGRAFIQPDNRKYTEMHGGHIRPRRHKTTSTKVHEPDKQDNELVRRQIAEGLEEHLDKAAPLSEPEIPQSEEETPDWKALERVNTTPPPTDEKTPQQFENKKIQEDPVVSEEEKQRIARREPLTGEALKQAQREASLWDNVRRFTRMITDPLGLWSDKY